MAAPAAAQAQDSAARSRDAWQRTAQRGPAPGHQVAVDPTDFTSFGLDRTALAAEARQAPPAGAGSPVVLSIPKPDGSFARFDVTRGTTLSPELAARHPDIRDYVGTGVDDPSASLSLVISPEGAYAAIRGSDGTSYVEPRYRDDATTHVAFARQDLPNPAPFHEDEATAQQLETSLPPSALRPGPGETVPLRTYRLALINDPSYANFFGGTDAAVLAAKTALMARVNQIYQQDLGITMQLIPQTDALNLNTDAKAIQPGGPCGGAACYTAGQLDRCDDPTLTQTTIVLGQIVGARNYDIGHLALGGGGGLAAAGVGDALKAEGCTGSDNPTGDAWGVDFVAHEMGHQFDASHTWNGTRGGCTSANRANATAVEPGSGSTIMGYAGLCDDDNLQPHSDPYFSQQSQEQIYAWVDAPGDSRERPPLSSVQRVSLRDFNGVDSFDISSGGGQPETITNGANYTPDGIKAAIEAAIGANKTVTVTNWENQDGGALDQNGFTVTYDSDVDEPQLAVSNFSGGASGFVGDAVVGGTRRNGGTQTATANRAPTVQTGAGFTIPARTPFTLTATGSDPNPGDTLTYLWEERDAGNGQALGTEPGATGPLFRVFGVAQRTDTGAVYNSTPKNATTTNPARDFPDVAQVMADNTDAVKDCGPVATPTGNDCWSEYLPKVNRTMNFRVTARDGNAQAGGNGFADTVLTVSGGAGPFRLTSQATDTDNGSATTLPVTWDVAATNAAPINTANVRILLSTDDGATFSTVLAGSTPNDGSEAVPLPAGVQTTTGRIRIEGVGNVFYDVSRGRLSFDRTKEPPPSGGGGGTSGGGTTTTTSTTTTPTTPPLLPVTPAAPTSATIRLSAAKVQNFLRTGVVTVKVTVDRDAALTATGAIALGRAKASSAASLKLKSAKGRATAGKATTLKLKLTQRDKSRLRSAVRAKRTATAKISVKVAPTGLPPTVEKSTVRQKG